MNLVEGNHTVLQWEVNHKWGTYQIETDSGWVGFVKHDKAPCHSDATGGSVGKEVAGRIISDRLNLNAVPPTVECTFQGEPHSFQTWLYAEELPYKPTRVKNWRFRNIYLLDMVIGNSDRHEANMMTTPQGAVHAIDNSYGFVENSRITSHMSGSTGDWCGEPLITKHREALKKFLEDQVSIASDLHGLISVSAIFYLFERVGKILADGRYREAW